jgi:hypothetical protein
VGVIFFAEQLNALAGAHWQSFAGQDYFDERGVFFSALVSAPLLCLMFVILVSRGSAKGLGNQVGLGGDRHRPADVCAPRAWGTSPSGCYCAPSCMLCCVCCHMVLLSPPAAHTGGPDMCGVQVTACLLCDCKQQNADMCVTHRPCCDGY